MGEDVTKVWARKLFTEPTFGSLSSWKEKRERETEVAQKQFFGHLLSLSPFPFHQTDAITGNRNFGQQVPFL